MEDCHNALTITSRHDNHTAEVPSTTEATHMKSSTREQVTDASAGKPTDSTKHSLSYHTAQTVQALMTLKERTTRSKFRQVAPPAEQRRLTLAMLPSVEVVISNDWEPEKIINSRVSSKTGKYEYLVVFKGTHTIFNSWKSTEDIVSEGLSHMVPEYESKLTKLTAEKQHLQAWYEERENFVMQWRSFPCFIVPYGGGEIQKFCAVVLNKKGNSLVCRKAHHPDHPVHKVHVHLVEKKLTELGLRVWPDAKYIGPESDLQPASDTGVKKDHIQKPFSTTPINIISGSQIEQARLEHYHKSPLLPEAFIPLKPPEECNCIEVDREGKTCKGKYKAGPEACSKSTVLWLPHGPPVVGRKAYVWRCKKNNPACTRHYDGHSAGIFNYSDSTMVSHVLLYDFLFGLITGYATPRRELLIDGKP